MQNNRNENPGARIDALLSPSDIERRRKSGFAGTTCVVFDVLRATSVMVAGLASGAAGYVPVEEIGDALKLFRQQPEYLLAGERGGLKITAEQGGGIDFHLGNSPREHSTPIVNGKTIVTTTTNGTRALRSCLGADQVLVASLLNLSATAQWLLEKKCPDITLVCAGTGEALALEDALAAGALCSVIQKEIRSCALSDSACVALAAFSESEKYLRQAIAQSSNGRRMMGISELRDDVEFCSRLDSIPLVVGMGLDGVVRKMV